MPTTVNAIGNAITRIDVTFEPIPVNAVVKASVTSVIPVVVLK